MSNLSLISGLGRSNVWYLMLLVLGLMMLMMNWWCWCCVTWEKFEWFEDRLHIKRLALFWPTVAKNGMLVNVTKSCFFTPNRFGQMAVCVFCPNWFKWAQNGPKWSQMTNMPGLANFGRKWATSNLLQNCKNAFFKLSSFTDRYSTLSSAVTSTWVTA